MLASPKSFKNSYKDFRRFVLEKAYKDINGQTALKYSWEPIKTGRAVTSIKFTFTKEIQARRTHHTLCQVDNKNNIPEITRINNSYSIFSSFFNKFHHSESVMLHIQAHRLWVNLNVSGKAPLASDVPPNNKLSVVDFLEQWKNNKNEA